MDSYKGYGISVDTIIYVVHHKHLHRKRNMPKWKKDAKEFKVGVNYNDRRGYQSSIPKPVMETLGSPEAIRFVITGKKVEIEAADDSTAN